MKPPPTGWPRICQNLYYEKPAAAIDWLCKAFDFEVRLKVEGDDGDILHSELTYGEGLIMVGGSGRKDDGKEAWQAQQTTPKSIHGGNTQSMCIFVDDVDSHCAKAVEHGAKIHREPKTDDYGDDYWADRTYGATDPEGHMWWFMQRVRSGKLG
jgi:uncharacterized glyoxalase superfamily protein PhnB